MYMYLIALNSIFEEARAGQNSAINTWQHTYVSP